jgi:hypothetical protein
MTNSEGGDVGPNSTLQKQLPPGILSGLFGGGRRSDSTLDTHAAILHHQHMAEGALAGIAFISHHTLWTYLPGSSRTLPWQQPPCTLLQG